MDKGQSLLLPLFLCDHLACSPPGSSVNGDFPGKNTGVGCHFLLQGIFPGIEPGSEPGSPALQAAALLAELAGKPPNPFLNEGQFLQNIRNLS